MGGEALLSDIEAIDDAPVVDAGELDYEAQRLTPEDQRRRRPPEDLIRTAERMLATEGPAVSLRKVAREAGHRNTSVVQYHFGSREGLIRAIAEYRVPSIIRRRSQLIALLAGENRQNEIRGLVEVLIRALLELDPESYYVELLAQLQLYPELEEEYIVATALIQGPDSAYWRIHSLLDHLPQSIATSRLRLAWVFIINAIAARRIERRRQIRPLVVSDDLFVHELVSPISAMLQAEFSSPRLV